MPTTSTRKTTPAQLREVHLAMPDSDFDTLVEYLRAVLVVPKRPGFAGCGPCKSGLDRIVIDDPVWRDVASRGPLR